MQISLRSHLIAGTAAVVGVSAIAMTPVTMQHLRVPVIPVPSVSAGVALAAFDSPISQLIETLGLTNTYLFSPTPWQTYAPWSDLSALGVVPQIINDHLPIISQLGQNGADYLLQTFTGLGTSAYLLSEGVWNAAANLLALNIPGAITTLLTAVQNAGQVALDTGQYVLSGVVTRATAVVNAVVGLIPNIATAVVGQVTALVGSVVKVVTDTFAALGSANPLQNTWNAVVDGLLGPTGIPGVLNALTIGYGIDPAPPQVPAFVPSIRTVLTTAVQDVAGALATTNPAPPPVAASAAARRSAAAKQAAAKPAAAVEASVSGDSVGSSAAPVADAAKAVGSHRSGAGRSARIHASAQ